MAEPRTPEKWNMLQGAAAEPRAPEKWWRNERGTSLLLIMQEALELELLGKLLCLCLAAPDTAIKLGKPVPEHLWGAVLQELHVWGTEQQQVVQSGGARHHDVQM